MISDSNMQWKILKLQVLRKRAPMIIFIHHQMVEHVKELNYIVTKVDTNTDSNFNVRRLTVSLGSSKLKYS